jgi:hypothetical protein
MLLAQVDQFQLTNQKFQGAIFSCHPSASVLLLLCRQKKAIREDRGISRSKLAADIDNLLPAQA